MSMVGMTREFKEQHDEITCCVGWEKCQCNRCKLARLHRDNPEYRSFILSVYRTLRDPIIQNKKKEGYVMDKDFIAIDVVDKACRECGVEISPALRARLILLLDLCMRRGYVNGYRDGLDKKEPRTTWNETLELYKDFNKGGV